MSLFSSPIPAPVFDSDESDQQSNDSSSYLSFQFHQHARLSFSPKLTLTSASQVLPSLSNILDESTQDDDYSRASSEISWQSCSKVKRQRLESNSNSLSTHRYHTRLVAKRESNVRPLMIERFENEFLKEAILNEGKFNEILLCRHRLDGLSYAIKCSKKSILSNEQESTVYREICAHAILGSMEHFVRYYSAWIEPNGRIFIQLEYCSGGSLEDWIEENRRQQPQKFVDESDLKMILHQISDALSFIHRRQFVHLNVKPSAIVRTSRSSNETIYKLTDFSRIQQCQTTIIQTRTTDRRYVSLELDEETFSNELDKSDIYSLGLTLYVCGTNILLPNNGLFWRNIRSNMRNSMPNMSHCSTTLNELLFDRICHIDPRQRPSAQQVNNATIH